MALSRDATPQWHKSSYSGSGDSACVEVADVASTVLVRDTKQRGTGPVLRLVPAAWQSFVDGCKAGEFNL